ncbi:MAG: hypothetical protein KDA41_06725, partial [Planctomycetales bacterium]|nr:hypothetical protein [Planctomycetales bacterium]
MSRIAASGVLLDIEGTTSSVRFVYDEMFPFARRELDAYLQSHWRDADCQAACAQIAADAGYASLDDWAGAGVNDEGRRTLVAGEVRRLMDGDVKATGLKELQG